MRRAAHHNDAPRQLATRSENSARPHRDVGSGGACPGTTGPEKGKAYEGNSDTERAHLPRYTARPVARSQIEDEDAGLGQCSGMTPEERVTDASPASYKGQVDTATPQPLSVRVRVGSRIAAAKRYAGRHRVLLAAAVVVLCGGGAAGAILASGSSYVATRPIGAALVKSPVVGSAASPYHRRRVLVQIATPTILNFVPGATFAIAVIVTNKASASITLERTRAVLSRRTPLRQIGTRLIAWKPFVCPPGAFCPAIDPIGDPPYGTAERPVPLTVAPGHEALAQLHFQFRDCSPVAGASAPTTKRVTVVYRTPDGTTIRQRLALGVSTPQLTRIPRANACH
jgi:hypothetical protein